MPSVSKSELRLLRPSTRCAEITERPSDFKTSGGGANLTGGTHHAPKAHDNGKFTQIVGVTKDFT